MFLKITDRFGQPTAMNMALFALVAQADDGTCKLYPGGLNERYHGDATLVMDSLDAFRELPGFIALEEKLDTGEPVMLVNMERIARVVPGSGGSYLEIAGSRARIETTMSFDEILAAMGPMLANRPT